MVIKHMALVTPQLMDDMVNLFHNLRSTMLSNLVRVVRFGPLVVISLSLALSKRLLKKLDSRVTRFSMLRLKTVLLLLVLVGVCGLIEEWLGYVGNGLV